MEPLRVNLVSEASFIVGGHGVATAFDEDQKLLRTMSNLQVTINSWRSADVQHVHTLGPVAVSQLLRARGRSVVTAHITPGSEVGGVLADRYWGSSFLRYAIACYNLAGIVAVPNKHFIPKLRIAGVKRPLLFLPNTVSPNELRRNCSERNLARQRQQVAADVPVVVAVGQLLIRKGLKTFIHCARLMPEARFYWVGGQIFGPATANYFHVKRLIGESPRNLRFTGSVTRAEVLNYLSIADLFFHPSYHENCPMAVLEAAVMGLPLLLRDLRQYYTLFGAACMYGNEKQFPELVKQCLYDSTLKERLSSSSRELGKEFSSHIKGPRLVDAYYDLKRGELACL